MQGFPASLPQECICKGHVLPVHIKHTKFTLKHLSLHFVCFCGSKGLPWSSKQQWSGWAASPPHTEPAAPCSALLISNPQNRHQQGVWTKSSTNQEWFSLWTSTKNQSKKMSLVPLVLVGQHNTRGRFYGSHLCSFLSHVQAVDSGNEEHIALKKNLLELLLSSRSLKPHG